MMRLGDLVEVFEEILELFDDLGQTGEDKFAFEVRRQLSVENVVEGQFC